MPPESPDKECPLCTGPLHSPVEVDVCRKCHAGLQISGALAMTSTGEFEAIVADPGERARAHAAVGNASEVCCSWCSKGQSAVRKMLSRGGSVHICNECVSLCADILRMELGDDFGGE